jgi:predicted CXXCH cytochrome family protein
MTNKSLLKNVMTRLTGGVAVVFLAMGVLGSSQAVAGIASTKHNLGTTGTGSNHMSVGGGGTGEICVFCHTPHGADISASVPLWNRVMAQPTTYTTYNSLGTSSLDGATAPVGSVSLACLSCHDGAQAMNVMINQPGSGGYNSAGAAAGGTWEGTRDTISGVTNIALIGTNLKNDHPIGIQYCGGIALNAAFALADLVPSTSCRDKDFNTAQYKDINGSPVWWVDSIGGTADTRDKKDMMLYTRDTVTSIGAGGTSTTGGVSLTGPQAYVECASCHDPHVSTTATFLRIDNTGSAVCLACHIK